MMDLPHIAFHGFEEGRVRVFMHLGDKLRSFTSGTAEEAATTIAAVATSEFGIDQEKARDFATNAVTRKRRPAEADQALTDAMNRMLKAESDVRLLRAEVENLTAALAAATKQPEPAPASVPAADPESKPKPVPEAEHGEASPQG